LFRKIICTGGSGRLGQYVSRRLAGSRNLSILDLNPPQDEALGKQPFIKADILDIQALSEAFKGCDAIAHLAAIPNPRTAPAEVTFNTNVQGAWNVMHAAEQAGVKRIVIASSDSVFGLSYNPADWPPQYLPVDETHPVRPTEFYSLSKRVTETIAESFAARGKLEVMVLRPVHIVFPEEYPELEERGSNVENYHFWSFVAPEDVAQAFDLALSAEYRGFEVFSIAAASGLNTRPTLTMAAERWGAALEIRNKELYARNPTASVVDISRARKRLGYNPQVGWQKMLADHARATKSVTQS
jgi:nucleoside-diphosphate-sugar epimerase